MPNIYEPDFDQDRHAPDGFCDKRAFLGEQAGGERLGMRRRRAESARDSQTYHPGGGECWFPAFPERRPS